MFCSDAAATTWTKQAELRATPTNQSILDHPILQNKTATRPIQTATLFSLSFLFFEPCCVLPLPGRPVVFVFPSTVWLACWCVVEGDGAISRGCSLRSRLGFPTALVHHDAYESIRERQLFYLIPRIRAFRIAYDITTSRYESAHFRDPDPEHPVRFHYRSNYYQQNHGCSGAGC